MSFCKHLFLLQVWNELSLKGCVCKHIHESPDLRLFSCHLCLRASVCEFEKYESKSDIKKG